MKHYNGLLPGEAERLAMLAEEAAEIIQCVGKILRHGYENHHPHTPHWTNRMALTREVADFTVIVNMMEEDFDPTIGTDMDTVTALKLRYTHHQLTEENEVNPLNEKGD